MLDFLANHYILFIILALFMLFALIGYLVDDSVKESRFIKKDQQTLELQKNLEKAQASNMTLNQMVQNPKGAAASEQPETLDDPITELLEKDS